MVKNILPNVLVILNLYLFYLSWFKYKNELNKSKLFNTISLGLLPITITVFIKTNTLK